MLATIFFVFFKIGILSFGGGYTVISTIQQEIVNNQGWLTTSEYLDIITISQITPGPLAINSSTFVGMKTMGIPGAIVATIGCILGGVLLSLVLYKGYSKLKDHQLMKDIIQGLKSASLAMITAAFCSMVLLTLYGNSNLSSISLNVDWRIILCIVVGIIIQRIKKLDSMKVLMIMGVVGFFFF